MATGKASKGIRLKRAYEPPERGDGYRVLVDRLWPRGLKKNEAAIDEHLKEVAPSEALRKWFGHDPARWAEFRRRYDFRGDDEVTMREAMKLMDELQQMEELERQLRRVQSPNDLDKIDPADVQKLLGDESAQDLELPCRALPREDRDLLPIRLLDAAHER